MTNPLYYRVPRQSRPFVKVAAIETLGAALVGGAVMPFAGIISRRLGASVEMLTVLSMAPFFGAILNVPAGRLGMFLRRGAVAAAFRIIARAALLAAGYAVSPVLFVWILAVFLAFEFGGKGAFSSLLRTHVPASARAGILRSLRIGAVLLAVPVTLAANRVFDAIPDRAHMYVFPLAGAAALLLALPLFGLPRRAREAGARASERGLLAEWNVLATDKRFALFIVVFFLGALGEKIAMPIRPILFNDELGLKYSEVGLSTGVAGGSLAVAGFLFWGFLLRRTQPVPVLAVCMLLKAIRPALWAAAPYADHPLAWIIAGEGVFRFMISGVDLGVNLAILRMSDSRRVPLYLGVHYLFMAVRGLGGPVVGLGLYRAGVSVPGIYLIVYGIVVAGGLALAALHWKWRDGLPGRSADEDATAGVAGPVEL